MTRLTAAALTIACALTTQLAAQSKPLITPKDYGKWELLGAARLSPRGDWAAIPVSRVSEENELRIKGGPRDTTIVAAYGAGAVFSADGKWVVRATFRAPGTYVLRCQAHDGGLSTTGDVTFVVEK